MGERRKREGGGGGSGRRRRKSEGEEWVAMLQITDLLKEDEAEEEA